MRCARVAIIAALGLLTGTSIAETGAELRVLAAGATEATVREVVGAFEKARGCTVVLTFAAVGALRDRAFAGEPADVAVVTPAIIAELEARHLVRAGSRVDLGRVGGGIAVRAGAPHPAVTTPEELKRALLDAEEVYYADPATATAGAAFMKVVDRLGIGDAVRKKGHPAEGGRAAMQAMAKARTRAIGVTQVSEILAVPGVTLIAPYPGDLQTLTTYSGVVLEATTHTADAEAFLKFLRSPEVQAKLAKAGFESAGP